MPAAYGLFAATGCFVAVLWLARHRTRMGVSDGELWAALWIMLVAALAGAKGLFVLLGWEHYARGELRVWADFPVGFVWFGGLAAAALAGFGFARVRRLDFWRGADYFAVAVPVGHAIGRVGCFATGCCGGRAPHPVQLYEAAGLLGIAWLCAGRLALVEAGIRPHGSIFRLYLALYGILRFVLDPLRADGRPERVLGLSLQQLITLAVVALAVAWSPPARRSSAPSMPGTA